MRSILVLNSKGGTGKTTLACKKCIEMTTPLCFR